MSTPRLTVWKAHLCLILLRLIPSYQRHKSQKIGSGVFFLVGLFVFFFARVFRFTAWLCSWLQLPAHADLVRQQWRPKRLLGFFVSSMREPDGIWGLQFGPCIVPVLVVGGHLKNESTHGNLVSLQNQSKLDQTKPKYKSPNLSLHISEYLSPASCSTQPVFLPNL